MNRGKLVNKKETNYLENSHELWKIMFEASTCLLHLQRQRRGTVSSFFPPTEC